MKKMAITLLLCAALFGGCKSNENKTETKMDKSISFEDGAVTEYGTILPAAREIRVKADTSSSIVVDWREDEVVHVEKMSAKEEVFVYKKSVSTDGKEKGGPLLLKMDLMYSEKEGEKTPVILFIPGGGFIGVEVAENLKNADKQVALIEGTDQILAPFDYDMVQILHKELDDNGVELHLSSTVTAIDDEGVTVKTAQGEQLIPAQAVIMAIGVAPETKLAVDAGLELGETRGIRVNSNYQTSDPDIYAVGDAIETYDALAHRWGRLALAGPAQRQARAAADHMRGMPVSNRGYIGSSCLRVFGRNAACTGLSEKAAKAAGYSYDSVMLFPTDKVGIMPGSHYLAFKLVFEVPTGKILGAQAIGAGEADKRVDVIATMITMGGTIADLKDLELCYAPLFSTAKDVVNFAALIAENVLTGRMPQVHVSEVRGLVESGAYIVDVREEGEFARGHLKGAHNVPLSQLRSRMDEIPRDVPVYLHCRSSQRSYYALCCLRGNGWTNVVNISGSFLGISLYEYFNDKMLGREPIVTAYNCN